MQLLRGDHNVQRIEAALAGADEFQRGAALAIFRVWGARAALRFIAAVRSERPRQINLFGMEDGMEKVGTDGKRDGAPRTARTLDGADPVVRGGDLARCAVTGRPVRGECGFCRRKCIRAGGWR